MEGGIVGLEPTVKGNPTKEVVVRSFRHASGGHVDVSLRDVDVVKGQAVEREAIRPVRRWIGDHTQRCQARLGEYRGVVHEATEMVGQRDGAIGLVPGDVVHQWFEGRGE